MSCLPCVWILVALLFFLTCGASGACGTHGARGACGVCGARGACGVCGARELVSTEIAKICVACVC